MRIGRNFNFSLYCVWTIQVFSDCACVTSIKIHKKNILIRTFMLPIVTILWDMNIFQNLEKAGDFFFFFNPFQEIGTIKITRNTIMVKSWGKAAGSRASFKLGSKAVSVASQLEVVM